MPRRPNKFRAVNYAQDEKLTYAPQISVRVPEAFKVAVRKCAEAEEKSISAWVTEKLAPWVESDSRKA